MRFADALSVLRSALAQCLAPFWLFVLHPLWRSTRGPGEAPWVFGGHRGRAYADNASEVHQAALRAGRSVVWIANDDLARRLRARGLPVLVRHSWAARRAISRAGVLVYSHGEDDLDLQCIWLRKRLGLRVYLNHCLNFLKAGGVLEPRFAAQGEWTRRVRRWLMTDCDLFLCASDPELANFGRSYPMHAGKFRLGGGAHLDSWLRAFSAPPAKRLFWFPTFRDTAAGRQRLQTTIAQVTSNEGLRKWLLEQGYEFYIGAHINSAVLASNHLDPPFFARSLDDLVSEVGASEVLISDYSGVVFDYLLSGRPQILFAFDLDDYLKQRTLYVDYQVLDFALHPRTAPELVEMIVTRQFARPQLRSAAERFRLRYLPEVDHSFAESSLQAIEQERARRDEQRSSDKRVCAGRP